MQLLQSALQPKVGSSGFMKREGHWEFCIDWWPQSLLLLEFGYYVPYRVLALPRDVKC